MLERVEFHWDDGPVPATAPAADVPPGFESRNVDLNKIMPLHWAKGRNVANVAEATASSWLLRSTRSQTGTISSSSDNPAKSAGLRVYSGRFAATAVAAMNRSVARRPRAFRPAAATAEYTRP